MWINGNERKTFDQWQVVCRSGQWICGDKFTGEFINVNILLWNSQCAKKFAKSITTPVNVRYGNGNQAILLLEKYAD